MTSFGRLGTYSYLDMDADRSGRALDRGGVSSELLRRRKRATNIRALSAGGVEQRIG